ncbi:MAG: hypothetical protein M1824_004686 [Vezdaea acicularis]|nr:MAG: hypothetical protein M1824_004686 [Vezdaea acicularis]
MRRFASSIAAPASAAVVFLKVVAMNVLIFPPASVETDESQKLLALEADPLPVPPLPDMGFGNAEDNCRGSNKLEVVKDKRQAFDQWHEERKRMRRRREQYMQGRLRK